MTAPGMGALDALGSASLQEFLKKARVMEEEQLTATNGELQALTQKITEQATASGSQSMMAGNFYDRDFEQSEYIQAQMASFDQLRQMKNAEISSIWAKFDEYGGATGEMRKAKQQEKALEEYKKSLDEAQAEMERKAQEAMAPKDENGEPVETDPTVPASLDMPDIAPNPISGAEAAAIAAPDPIAAAPAAVPAEQTAQAAAAVVSVNVVV